MGKLGAFYFDGGERVEVKTEQQGKSFFRNMCEYYEPSHIIDVESADHAWLMWLIQGFYDYTELCPAGVDGFVVHQNNQIGYSGDARGFSVLATGCNGRAVPFSYGKALRGVPDSAEGRVILAFRQAVQSRRDLHRSGVPPGARCPENGDLLTPANLCVEPDPPLFLLAEEFCVGDWKSAEHTLENEEELVKESFAKGWLAYYDSRVSHVFLSVAGAYERRRRQREAYAEREIVEALLSNLST
jgi:hypothetical protein